MKKSNRAAESATNGDLERMVEPLASFICATEKPKAALASVLALLCSEIAQTNRAASSFFATLSEVH
jgi:hypothetical protein